MTSHTYLFELRLHPDAPPETGEIVAADEADARRQLRVRYLCSRLPRHTRIVDRDSRRHAAARARSTKLRRLLRVLADHHRWLKGEAGGVRADLSGMDLAGVDLAGADLTDADLSHADLSDARLGGAILNRVTLAGASLRRADLSGADLRSTDFSDGDLRDCCLAGADLGGADLWRANLRGAVIDPHILHAGLGCVAPPPVQ